MLVGKCCELYRFSLPYPPEQNQKVCLFHIFLHTIGDDAVWCRLDYYAVCAHRFVEISLPFQDKKILHKKENSSGGACGDQNKPTHGIMPATPEKRPSLFGRPRYLELFKCIWNCSMSRPLCCNHLDHDGCRCCGSIVPIIMYNGAGAIPPREVSVHLPLWLRARLRLALPCSLPTV